MSSNCPLCGKSKTGESLFCPDCTVKLNSEYELSVPGSEDSQTDTPQEVEEDVSQEIIEEEQVVCDLIDEDSTTDDSIKGPAVVPKDSSTPGYNEKDWKKQRDDHRSDSEKSYYEITRDKKTNKTTFTIVFVLLLVLVLVAALFIYNQHVKGDNLERAKWELAQRENTIDGYLTYMDEYPKGTYVSEAHTKMLSLKSNETDAWQNLTTSENSVEFASFLEKYPGSPYERKVKNRFDSLMWESSLKENSTQGYSDYIKMSTSGDISGDYIGEAQKRYKMLEQSTPVDPEDLKSIEETVSGFFTALSNISHTDLSEYLAPVIVRFNKSTNVPREMMIGQLLLMASKADAKSLRFDPEVTKLSYEKMGNDTYNVNVPIQKILEGNNGNVNQVKGYIVHLKLDADFNIFSLHETKPFATAP